MEKQIIQDCYEDYQVECEADWAPRNVVMLSKREWLQTEDAKAFIKLITERRKGRR